MTTIGICTAHEGRHELREGCVQWDGSEETRLREELARREDVWLGRLKDADERSRRIGNDLAAANTRAREATARATAAESALAEARGALRQRDEALRWVLGEAPLPDGRVFDREAFGYGKPDANDRNSDSPVGQYWWRIPLRLHSGLAALARAGEQETPLAEMRARKDAAYAERNQCVALIVRMALALGWRAGVRDHEDKPGETWEPDWRSLVCIDLPTGQVSWHFHDSEKHLLAGLPNYPASWDGHDTPEKYRRVNATLAAPAGEPASSGQEKSLWHPPSVEPDAYEPPGPPVCSNPVAIYGEKPLPTPPPGEQGKEHGHLRRDVPSGRPAVAEQGKGGGEGQPAWADGTYEWGRSKTPAQPAEHPAKEK